MPSKQELLANGGFELANGQTQLGNKVFGKLEFPKEMSERYTKDFVAGYEYCELEDLSYKARTFLAARRNNVQLYQDYCSQGNKSVIESYAARLNQEGYPEYIKAAQKALVDWAMSIQ